jgi:hypothetical protein
MLHGPSSTSFHAANHSSAALPRSGVRGPKEALKRRCTALLRLSVSSRGREVESAQVDGRLKRTVGDSDNDRLWKLLIEGQKQMGRRDNRKQRVSIKYLLAVQVNSPEGLAMVEALLARGADVDHRRCYSVPDFQREIRFLTFTR